MRPSVWSHGIGLDSYSTDNVTGGIPQLITKQHQQGSPGVSLTSKQPFCCAVRLARLQIQIPCHACTGMKGCSDNCASAFMAQLSGKVNILLLAGYFEGIAGQDAWNDDG